MKPKVVLRGVALLLSHQTGYLMRRRRARRRTTRRRRRRARRRKILLLRVEGLLSP